jgi:hypothetical protein
MEKIVITGRIFEKILSKSGFTKADYARHVSKNDKKGKTRQWASGIILKNSTVEVPDRWVQELKELVGEESFTKWAKWASGGDGNGLGDAPGARLTQSEVDRRMEESREEFQEHIIPERAALLDSLPYEG